MTYIEHPEGGVIYSSDFDLNPEQIAAARELLLAGLELARKQKAYNEVAPKKSYSQFFGGDWNFLKIKEIKEITPEGYYD